MRYRVLNQVRILADKIWKKEKAFRHWVYAHLGRDLNKLDDYNLKVLLFLLEGKLITGDCPIPEHQNNHKKKRRKLLGNYENFSKNKAKVMACDGGKCRRCGSLEQLTVDHILPLYKGGGRGLANLQILCVRCHTIKSKFDQEEGRRRMDEIGIPENARLSRYYYEENLKSRAKKLSTVGSDESVADPAEVRDN